MYDFTRIGLHAWQKMAEVMASLLRLGYKKTLASILDANSLILLFNLSLSLSLSHLSH